MSTRENPEKEGGVKRRERQVGGDYISWSHVAIQGRMHAHFSCILCRQPNNPPSIGLPLLHPTPETPPPPPLSIASLVILSVGHGTLGGTICPFSLYTHHTSHNTDGIRTWTTDHCYPPSTLPPPPPNSIS